MLVSAALIVFAGLLLYAAVSDLRSLTIPNWLSIAMAGAFPVFALAMGMAPLMIAWHIGVGFVVLAFGFALFQMRVFGGGDAKLLAAVSVWTGYALFMPFIVWTALAGGLLAIYLLMYRRYAKVGANNAAFMERLKNKKTGIPYGIAIMGGGMMVLPQLLQRFTALTLP